MQPSGPRYAYTAANAKAAYGPGANEMTLSGGGGDPERAPGKVGPVYSKRDMDIENDEDDIEQGRSMVRSGQ